MFFQQKDKINICTVGAQSMARAKSMARDYTADDIMPI
jgi:hypothetical protein